MQLKIHRGSYESAHVLLNSLNELGKRDKMRGLSSILSIFRNKVSQVFSFINPFMPNGISVLLSIGPVHLKGCWEVLFILIQI